ncbi:MAG TPA: hypothetical protein VK750_00905 [Cytophagaceae bacterium]|jgi:hypothetical protein|nr:hypothetical protein [Cytophagaceae bacterium]
MTRKITNALIFILTILAAELIVEYVKHFLKFKTGFHDKYILTLIGMAIIVAVYYPVFGFVHYLTEHLTKGFVHASKQKAGNELLGIIIAFIIGGGILFLIYLHQWYKITIW